MGSSPGFGSYTYDIIRAIHTRFPFGSTPSGLAGRTHKLVGSFFNRHAMEVIADLADSL